MNERVGNPDYVKLLTQIPNPRLVRGVRKSGSGGTGLDTTVPEFPLEVFPEALQRYATEVSASVGCPLDFVTVPMLSVAGVALGTSVVVKPKSDWFEFPSLWTIILGDSGSRKSPALRKVTRPLTELQRAYAEQAARSEDTLSMRQVMVTDFTMEALTVALSNNPRGIIVIADEASGMVRSFNQYRGGRGNDRQQMLKLWDSQDILTSRLMRDTQYIHRPYVSIVGNLQPEVLTNMGRDFSTEDGFIQRFLFSFPDRLPRRVARAVISPQANEDWNNIVNRLYAIPMVHRESRPIPFTSAALHRFDYWRENEIYAEAESGELPPVLISVWDKLDTYCVRIALVLHCLTSSSIESNPTEIDEESLLGATKVVNYFKEHARRVYSNVLPTAHKGTFDSTKRIMDWIINGGEEISTRDVQRKFAIQREKTHHIFMRLQDEGYGTVSVTDRGAITFIQNRHDN